MVLAFAAYKYSWTRIVGDHRYILTFCQRVYNRQITAQPLPRFLQWQHSTCACLQVHMVGCTRTAFGSIVENHQLTIIIQELMNFSIICQNGLRNMFFCRYRIMNRQYRERVDKQFKFFVNYFEICSFGRLDAQRKQGRFAIVRLSIFAPVLTIRAGLNCTTKVLSPIGNSRCFTLCKSLNRC